MSIEERILNDNSCSPYVDKGRGYVEIAFKDGAYWGYEQGLKDAIDKACKWMKWIRERGSYYDTFIAEESIRDFRQMMERTGESVLDYIKIED